MESWRRVSRIAEKPGWDLLVKKGCSGSMHKLKWLKQLGWGGKEGNKQLRTNNWIKKLQTLYIKPLHAFLQDVKAQKLSSFKRWMVSSDCHSAWTAFFLDFFFFKNNRRIGKCNISVCGTLRYAESSEEKNLKTCFASGLNCHLNYFFMARSYERGISPCGESGA